MSSRRRRSAAKQARQRQVWANAFWGSDEVDSEAVELVRPAADPTSLIRSLGTPPLHGRETNADALLTVIYGKAAALATALAAANELLATDPRDAREVHEDGMLA